MTTLQKTEAKTTWNIEKIQEMNAHAFTHTMKAAMTVLGKHGEEAMKEFQHMSREPMIKYYKDLGVKTPLDLVRHKAEYETNLFGSKIVYFGDEKEASVRYESCAIWNNMKACGMSKEEEAKMGECFQTCVSSFAKEFGFTGEVKFENEIAIVTFRK